MIIYHDTLLNLLYIDALRNYRDNIAVRNAAIKCYRCAIRSEIALWDAHETL